MTEKIISSQLAACPNESANRHCAGWQKGLRRFDLDATKNSLHINWAELKTKLRKRWGRITEDDLARIDGNSEELVRVLRNRYGYGKAQAEIEIDQWLLERSEQ